MDASAECMTEPRLAQFAANSELEPNASGNEWTDPSQMLQVCLQCLGMKHQGSPLLETRAKIRGVPADQLGPLVAVVMPVDDNAAHLVCI